MKPHPTPAASAPAAPETAGPADAEAPPVPGRRLSTYLVLLGFTIAIPALIFSAFLVIRFTGIQRGSMTLVTQETANAISHAVDREISGMITTLKVLASSPLLDSGDLEGFHARTRRALAGSLSHVLLLDESLQQLLNTRVEYGTPLGSTSDPSSAETVLRTQSPYVSDLFFGAVAEEHEVNVLVPVTHKDGTRQVLIMTRSSKSFLPIISEYRLPRSWSASLIDRDNKVIAGSEGQRAGEAGPFAAYSGRAGQNLPPTVVRVGGQRVVFAIRASYVSGWRVVAWAPAAVLERPLWSSWSLLLLTGLVLLVLTALLAVWAANRVAGPILTLANHARALGKGSRVPTLDTPILEINEVSRTLARASAERRRAEDRIRYLMRELSHRAKNQLAVVVAMARQTANTSDDLEAFQATFSERIQGLARSTDLLVRQDWRGVVLDELVNAYLQPFVSGEPSRVAASGPAIELLPSAAQHLGLAFHELATNAAKYGALSVPEGSVTIRWSIGGNAESRFRISWEETGGPEVREPDRSGFGSVVVERMTPRSLDGEVTHRYAPTGVVWTLEAPLAAVCQETAEADGHPLHESGG